MANLQEARRARLSGAFFAAGLALCARTAAAQTDFIDVPIPGIGPPPLTGDIEAAGKRAFWRAGRQRWFFAATGEIGNLYLRGGAAVGYGRPHWSWAGIEGSSAVSPNGGSTYGGLRFASPWIDVRAGARYTFTTNQHFLEPRDSYTRDDTESIAGPNVRYVTLEAEAATSFPVPRGSISAIVGFYRPMGTPEGYNLFDQTLQIVAAPGLLWRARATYLARVDRWDMFRLGAAVEALGNPARDHVVVRAGPSISVFITHHLEAYATGLLVVYSRDALGLGGAQLGEVGARYRWATGDRWPEIP